MSACPAGPACAQEHTPPFIATSTGANVNVRAGQSANFERLCQLERGEEVIVVGREFSWYKIQLPPQAKIYVSKDYIQYLGANAGGVAGADVNVRAGQGIHHTVVGRLSKGEQIYIQEDLPDWYRIEPVADIYGWVSEEYLAFKTKDTSRFTRPRERRFFEEDIVREEPLEDLPEETLEEAAAPAAPAGGDESLEGVFVPADTMAAAPHNEEAPAETASEYAGKSMGSFTGIVEKNEDVRSDGIFFKIVDGGKPVCYIQGLNHMLGRFVGQRVSVEGTVNQDLLSQYPHPVIMVVKVRLML